MLWWQTATAECAALLVSKLQGGEIEGGVCALGYGAYTASRDEMLSLQRAISCSVRQTCRAFTVAVASYIGSRT
jgi:hypothetical protein